MPKRDPFADKRKTLKGVKPKQAARQIKNKDMRDRARIPKATRELKAIQSEAQRTAKQLEVQKQMLELMASAPTPAQQRKIILGIFSESGVNPIQVMIDSLPKDPETGQVVAKTKDDLAIVSQLASYFAPKPKSIDLQAEVQGNLTINVTDFSKTTLGDLKSAADQAKQVDPIFDISSEEEEGPDYSEFIAPEATQSVKENPDGTL